MWRELQLILRRWPAGAGVHGTEATAEADTDRLPDRGCEPLAARWLLQVDGLWPHSVIGIFLHGIQARCQGQPSIVPGALPGAARVCRLVHFGPAARREAADRHPEACGRHSRGQTAPRSSFGEGDLLRRPHRFCRCQLARQVELAQRLPVRCRRARDSDVRPHPAHPRPAGRLVLHRRPGRGRGADQGRARAGGTRPSRLQQPASCRFRRTAGRGRQRLGHFCR